MKSVIILPTYNERENLRSLVEEIFSLETKFAVIVVDDNSPDGTGEVADQLAEEYPNVYVLHRPGKLGLGTAYIQGFKLALQLGADCIFEMDADLSHDPGYLPSFLEKVKGCDVVVGSRYMNGISVVNWSLWRLILSFAANKYAKVVTGLKISDCTSGFKCFRRKVLADIDLDKVRSNGYSFQIEMNYKAYKKGYKIEEIPIVFTERRQGKSKISWKIIFEAFFIVWKLRLGFG